MRTIYKFPLAILTAIVLFIPFSCTDDFDELNTNPKLVTDEIIKPGLMLTYVLKNSSFEIMNQGRVGEYSGYTSRGDSGQPLTFGNFGSFNGYTDHIVNLAAIIRLTQDEPTQSHMNAIARIWKVWVFHRMTDAYGDIPYSEVAQSVDKVIISPAYDTQESIYTDLLNELKEAAAQLNSGTDQESFGAADVVYGGDADSWKRFANSLRLRLAIRVRYADASLAQTHISEVLGSDLITSNSQSAVVTSEGEGAVDLSNTNPLYQNFVNGNAGAGNATVVGITLTENLLSTDDPRMPVYLKPNINDEYIGRAINMDPDEKEAYTEVARMDDAFIQAEFDFNAMLAAEVSFLRAEAALAGLSSENANDLFKEGIQLSMEQYGVDTGDITTFLASAAGSLAGTEEEKLEQIIVQKYLALFGDSYEAWTEHRRTGYPRQWIGSLSALDTDNAMPRRSAYPLGEYNLNGENVKVAASRLVGGDLLTSRVWWDAKAGVPFDHPKQGVFPPYD